MYIYIIFSYIILNNGGRQLPPPPVPPVRHAGALESTERAAHCQRPVRQGGGEESPTAGGRGDTVEYG